MRLGLGNFLVFEVVDEECLVVSIFPRIPFRCFKKTLRASHSPGRSLAKLVSMFAWLAFCLESRIFVVFCGEVIKEWLLLVG